jgi:hypothetical protein
LYSNPYFHKEQDNSQAACIFSCKAMIYLFVVMCGPTSRTQKYCICLSSGKILRRRKLGETGPGILYSARWMGLAALKSLAETLHEVTCLERHQPNLKAKERCTRLKTTPKSVSAILLPYILTSEKPARRVATRVLLKYVGDKQ